MWYPSPEGYHKNLGCMIQFIYFDVGGVVIKDFSGTNKWNELKSSIGVRPEQEKEFDEFFDRAEIELCAGKDTEALVPIMGQQFGLRFPPRYSFLADFVDRFERNESIWPFLKAVKEKYKGGLLTNMYPRMLDMIHSANLMPDIQWDVVIDSSIEKMQKPQIEIFQLAEEKCGFRGKEIFFVENTKRNVDAAQNFGWRTFLYGPRNPVESNQSLEELLLK